MSEYRHFKTSDQRLLAQQIADGLNDGMTRERHAEIAATVLTSDWLAAHDADVRKAALEEARDAILDCAPPPNADLRHDGSGDPIGSAYVEGFHDAFSAVEQLIRAVALGDAPTGPSMRKEQPMFTSGTQALQGRTVNHDGRPWVYRHDDGTIGHRASVWSEDHESFEPRPEFAVLDNPILASFREWWDKAPDEWTLDRFIDALTADVRAPEAIRVVIRNSSTTGREHARRVLTKLAALHG